MTAPIGATDQRTLSLLKNTTYDIPIPQSGAVQLSMTRNNILLFVLTVLGLAPCRVGQAEDYVWINITDKAAYAPRDGAGAVVFQDRMWLIGGWNPSDKEHFPRICNNEVWSSQDGAKLDSGEAQHIPGSQF